MACVVCAKDPCAKKRVAIATSTAEQLMPASVLQDVGPELTETLQIQEFG
jgi:hypothetical protein